MNYICIEYYYSFKNMIKVTSDARKKVSKLMEEEGSIQTIILLESG